KHLQKLQDETDNQFLHLDYATIQNLELIEALHSQTKQASLFSFLNECQSTMGSRTLKQWIIHPLHELEAIKNRQSQIQYLVLHHMDKETVRSALKQIYDMERIIAKISFKSANPSDIVRLLKTLNQVPSILKLCEQDAFKCYQVNQLDQLRELLNRAIDENSSSTLKDGNVFKNGYNAELDEYRKYQTEGQSWLLEFENQEKEKTQIKNLKLGYNRVFGYYIEVSKGSINLIKGEYGYTRRQTLSTGERYITQALKEKEEIILHAADKAYRLELSLFNELLETLQSSLREMQALAKTLSAIDVLQALATVSENPKYILPHYHTGFDLNIIEGRHPLLELKTSYVSNSTIFTQKESLHLLTGPNMGGKSTYMRQVALICIMGQMGMYVPADLAELPILDAIYTRMGASDDILQGQSTFMVEMMEANDALQKATQNSLILFDEIGRGTSTYDGMALAQAIVEYIATAIRCKTIFSTHYHELTHLETVLEPLKNTHVEVYEDKGDVCFLYRVKHGSADKSYGINVAKLAHLPNTVLDRASRLLIELESKKRVVQQTLDIVEVVHIPSYIQKMEDILLKLDINETTPLEALSYLNDFKVLLKESIKHGKD
ncbi:MAG: DNA mismatch repair protein MutS, partial [Erysipelotrichaceae bacterium]